MVLMVSMLMSEKELFVLITSPSLWLPKLYEHLTKPFVLLSTPVLIIFFWILRTIWLTIKYLSMAVALVAIGFVIIIVAMNFSDELKRFAPNSRADIKYGSLTPVSFPMKQEAVSAPIQSIPSCQQINCIRTRNQQNRTPRLPSTPVLPIPDGNEPVQ